MTELTSSSGGLSSTSGISEDESVSDQGPDTVEQPVVSLVPSEVTRKHVLFFSQHLLFSVFAVCV